MEWYAVQMCQAPVEFASFFGAIQLVALAAVWLFRIPFPNPVKGARQFRDMAKSLQATMGKPDRA